MIIPATITRPIIDNVFRENLYQFFPRLFQNMYLGLTNLIAIELLG